MESVLLQVLLITSFSALESVLAQPVSSPDGGPSSPAPWRQSHVSAPWGPSSASASWRPTSATPPWGPVDEHTIETATATDWLVTTEATDATAAWSASGERRTTTPACPNGVCTPRAMPGYCRAHDDPHFVTFDGKAYEMHQEGVFYLYKDKSNPLSVQAAFQICGGSGDGYCICAAAVRYRGEAFVIDKCIRNSLKEKANVVFRTGSGNFIRIGTYFSGFQVSLPTGVTVFVAVYDIGVPVIDVRASAANLNKTEGLCGVFNHNKTDDFTWRTSETSSINETYPYDFADSWRVPEGESLFDARTLQRIAACTRTLENPRGPKGVADACYLNLQPDDFLTNSTHMLTSTNRRRKRQDAVQGLSDGEWPVGWSYDLALTFCYKYVATATVVNECTTIVPGGVDVSQYIMNCVRDIFMTGGMNFSAVALNAALTNCMQGMEDHGIQALAVEDQMCPFNCSGHGTCSVGACSCDNGWGGFHCAVDMSSPPSLQSYAPSPLCARVTAGGSKCRAAYVFGAVFVNSSGLAAQATIYPQGQPALARGVKLNLTFVTSGVLEIAMRMPFCPKVFTNYNLDVSVSNDGVHFGRALTIEIAAGPAKRR